MPNRAKLASLYSKIKDIYIELPDYSFFHSPSSLDRKDNRFVGRKELARKLKNILCNSQTKSGAYLVTGYRGVGKTSLVNRVLKEISEVPSLFSLIKPHLRGVAYITIIHLLFHTFGFLNQFLTERNTIWIVIVSPSLIFAYTLSRYIFNTEVNLNFIVRLIDIFTNLINRNRTTQTLHVKLFLSFLFSITAYFLTVNCWDTSNNFLIISYLIYFALLVSIYLLIKFLERCLKITSSGTAFKSRFKYFKKTLNPLKYGQKKYDDLIGWLNYSNRVTIKLNLGHEELKEIDILRLITKDVESKYKKLTSVFWRFPLNYKVLKFIFIVLILNSVMFHWDDDDRKDFFNKTRLNYYFPSQTINSDCIKEDFEVFLTESGWDNISTVSINNRIAISVAFVDYYINKSYRKIIDNTFLENFVIGEQRAKMFGIPRYLDYLYVLFFLTSWWLGTLIAHLKPFGIISHVIVLKRLETLSMRISAQVSSQSGKSFGNKLTLFNFFSKKSTIYPIADVREIESELISIFTDIDKIPGFMGKPSFIFVLDELDKIQANQNKSIADKESEENNLDYSKNEFIPSTEETRVRRQVIATLMANLKHFFTTVRAKFIFIAGRELYDASLADISDRNYFLGSIFNDVFYVPSFLTEPTEDLGDDYKNDPGHMSYFHSSVEEYICQTVIPDYFRSEESRSLKTVHKLFVERMNLPNLSKYGRAIDIYRELEVDLLNNIKNLKDDDEQFIKLNWLYELVFKNTKSKLSPLRNITNTEISTLENAISKIDDHIRLVSQVLFSLKAFISYITYRSGGTPKKVINLCEQHIITPSEDIRYLQGIDYYRKVTVIGDVVNKGKTYLRFEPYDHYTFDLIDYLTKPFFYNIRRHVRNYGDKLMVSTSYLLDHLYKFHNTGFSWRNLEVTPEIIDVNKAPILRDLINDIVELLTYSHLEKITSGLYDFKFDSRIAHEIEYLSKLSEKESAAFNFTLDESQEIKKHYKRKLKLVLKENPLAVVKKEGQEGVAIQMNFLHSIALIQQSIGDLHYYDQEYDDAINAYQNAIFMFRNNDEPLKMDLLVIFIRIMMKLGHVLEKKQSNESALMAYGNLTLVILNSLDIDINNLFKMKKIYDPNMGTYFLYPDMVGGKSRYSMGSEETRFDYYEKIKKMELSKLRFKLLFKSMTIDTMRLIFQPSIAKLYVKEKVKVGGITWEDVEIVLDELAFLLNLIPAVNRRILEAEYYNKIGDLLYFKNFDNLAIPVNSRGFSRYFTNLDVNGFMKGITGCQLFYMKSLQIQLNQSTYKNKLADFFKLYNNTSKTGFLSFEQLKTLANNVSDLGDSLLPNDSNLFKLDDIWSKDLNIDIELVKKLPPVSGNVIVNQIENVLLCYVQAYKLHIGNDDHKRAAFQYLKILHIIVEKCDLKQINSNTLIAIKEHLVGKILSSLFRAYSSSSRPEIEKAKAIMKLDNPLSDYMFKYIVNQIPQVGEVQETIALYNYIKIYSDNGNQLTLASISPGRFPKTSLMYSRAVQLSVKIRANNKLFSDIDKNDKIVKEVSTIKEVERKDLFKGFGIKLNSDFPNCKTVFNTDHVTYAEVTEYLISDSIYCLTELIRILQNFGSNYISNYSFYAFAYHQRYEWTLRYEAYLAHLEFLNNPKINKPISQPAIYNHVRSLIGSESMDKLKPKYNIEKAVSFYTKCIELHEGKYVYQNMIDRLYYLDNDFDDEYLHFYSALERSKLPKIEEKKKELEKLLIEEGEMKSRLYDADHYMMP